MSEQRIKSLFKQVCVKQKSLVIQLYCYSSIPFNSLNPNDMCHRFNFFQNCYDTFTRCRNNKTHAIIIQSVSFLAECNGILPYCRLKLCHVTVSMSKEVSPGSYETTNELVIYLLLNGNGLERINQK